MGAPAVRRTMRWPWGRAPARLATNAPEGWPAVEPPPGSEESPQRRAAVMQVRVAAALKSGWASQAGAPRLARMNATLLVEEGVLQVPLLAAAADGRALAIYPFPEADEEAARRVQGAADVLARAGWAPPVWYAPAPLPAPRGVPEPPLEPWGAHLLERMDGRPPAGEYAAWWPTPGDPSFERSAARRHLARAQEALEGIQSWVFAAHARQLGLAPPDAGRVALPEEPASLVVQGPEDRPVALSVSREKGMGFHFHVAGTPPRYRDLFLRHFADYCEGWRRSFEEEEEGLERDEADPSPLAWWRATERHVLSLDGAAAVRSLVVAGAE